MNIEKIELIKISLMEIVEEESLDPTKSDYIIRASISLNLENLEFNKSKSSIKTILSDMYNTLLNKVNLPDVNYIGLWVKYEGELFDNSIKIQTLEDIEKYSPEKTNSLYEFLKMTLPEKE